MGDHDNPSNETILWRIGRVEERLNHKADKNDVKRIEISLTKLQDRVGKLVMTLVSATVSFAAAAILLILEITQK